MSEQSPKTNEEVFATLTDAQRDEALILLGTIVKRSEFVSLSDIPIDGLNKDQEKVIRMMLMEALFKHSA